MATITETRPTTFSPGLMQQIREQSGHTQESLARAVGQSLFSIRDYEKGRANPSVRRLAALADELGCSVADFFTGGVDR